MRDARPIALLLRDAPSLAQGRVADVVTRDIAADALFARRRPDRIGIAAPILEPLRLLARTDPHFAESALARVTQRQRCG
jgi:hypothetical protein